AFSAVGTVVHNAVTTVGNAVSSVGQGLSNAAQNFGNFLNQAKVQLTNLAQRAVHTIATVVHKVGDGLNAVINVLPASSFVKTALHTVVNVVTHPVATFKYAVHAATQFVQAHAATIVSFVASTAVFMGCEAAVTALTAGTASLPGAIGCSALSGAVGNAVNYAMTTPVSKWSVGGFAKTALEGAATGAISGALGELGTALLGPIVDAVASRLGPALVDDAADAATDAADSALD